MRCARCGAEWSPESFGAPAEPRCDCVDETADEPQVILRLMAEPDCWWRWQIVQRGLTILSGYSESWHGAQEAAAAALEGWVSE